MKRSADMLLRRIKALEKKNDIIGAIGLCSELLKLFPKNQNAIEIHEILKLELLKNEAAIRNNMISRKTIDDIVIAFQTEAYDQVLEKVRALGDPLFLPSPIPSVIGMSLVKNNQASIGLPILKQISQADESNIDHLNTLASAMKYVGEIESAIKIYHKIINKERMFSPALFNLGNLYKETKDYGLAVTYYRRALEIDPDDIEYNLGLLGVLGEVEKVQKSIELAIGLCIRYPNHVVINMELARLYEFDLNYSEALKFYDKVYEITLKELKIKPNAIRLEQFRNRCIAKKLECLFFLNQIDDLKRELLAINELYPNHIHAGAISVYLNHYLKYENLHNFCNNPIDFIRISNLSDLVQDYESFVSNLLCDVLRVNSKWEPSNKTTKSGYQSESVVFENQAETIVSLERILRQEICEYYNVFADEKCAFIKNWPNKYNVKGWYVRLLTSGHQDSHIHPGGWLSGVVYLKTVDHINQNEGAIEFGVEGYNLPTIKGAAPSYIHNPKVGDIVLFPSSLFHKTIPFSGDQERCIVAFDIVPFR